MSDITAKIGGDVSGFNAALRSTRKEGAELGKTLASDLMGPLAAIGSVAGVAELTKQMMEAGVEIHHNAQELGVTNEEYQRLSKMAKAVGADESALGMAFKTVSGTITDAARGSAEAADKLGRVGLAVEDLKGKKPAEQFEMVAKAIGAIQDPTERSATAVELFGRSGMRLAELAENFDSLKAKVSDATIMTDEAIEASVTFEKTMASLGSTIKNLVANSGIIEWLGGIAEGMNALVANGQKIAKQGGHTDKLSYQGGAGGLLGNIKDAWFGESGTSVQLAGVSEDERSKLEKMRKAKETSGRSTLQDQKDEEAKRAQVQQDTATRKDREAQAKRDQALAEEIKGLQEKAKYQQLVNQGKELEAKVQERIAELSKKAGRDLTAGEKSQMQEALSQEENGQDSKKVQDAVEELQQKAKYQQLVNEGKKEEAELQQKLYELEKARGGRSLSAEEADQVAQSMKALQDQKDAASEKARMDKAMAKTDAPEKISLEKIGAVFGGHIATDAEPKKQTTLLEGIKTVLEQIREKPETSSGEATLE